MKLQGTEYRVGDVLDTHPDLTGSQWTQAIVERIEVTHDGVTMLHLARPYAMLHAGMAMVNMERWTVPADHAERFHRKMAL